ncbi:hypothetical protein COT30_00730 [Candidatus Micrarchaeota archaeon CG08_land_8_20_14_0_20_49_17]|nr:MAG: hypothetical protein AUJ13_02425 [Candidatus Micrarchaeota archaeon CG1_02_49_24]PIU10166.1 MAG: hypothetical protein COT30_00730 [Candidatus Micrarchaeota archaeon CG08_land_8_20_14_0_20_49_17]PIU81584.1 MAG: hypothetical protein COS70_03365 [Candidatus Micrarchaeota archaeon CG06_land_8_20_14_3_00_50_6]HII54240.1 PIN domain-containing protein [Candidatus Micrarchaeota archaeon]
MELVADTNIVAAAILRDGLTRSLLFRSDIQAYSPAHLLDELEKYKPEFMEKSGLSPDSYDDAVKLVLRNVSTSQLDNYAQFEQEAKKISPDPGDWPFFALALAKNCAVWSNDKKLKNQKQVTVYDTTELYGILPKPERGTL